MERKYILRSLIVILGILTLFFTCDKLTVRDDVVPDSWIGRYSFYEFLPPNQNMVYELTLYEEGGLFAYIKIDGFHTLKRLKAKVWSDKDELIFEFYDYYTDEEGNYTIPESYSEGDILLKLKVQDNVLITEWGELQPMLIDNEEPGQYFAKAVE